MRILIVDDDEMTQCMLENLLAEAGYKVDVASNGQQALEVLRRGDCRLVISDWEMPEMNGLQLCQAIREEFLHYVYVILLTSHNSGDDVIKGMSAGADDFLSKPFNPNELAVRIRAGIRVLSLETRDITIFALAKLTESRDHETGAHLERVQNYCRVITEYLYQQNKFTDIIDRDYIRLIYTTSPLHDIGKVGMPDSVLLKPGRLTDREFEIMKCHTTIGSDTLTAALNKYPDVKFLRMARDIAHTHHERFDGEGYPNAISGEDIPLCGRIVALADVYDALISKRVYKKAFTQDVAQSIILEESGTHFDPEIVDAFVQNIDKFISIQEQYLELKPIAI